MAITAASSAWTEQLHCLLSGCARRASSSNRRSNALVSLEVQVLRSLINTGRNRPAGKATTAGKIELLTAELGTVEAQVERKREQVRFFARAAQLRLIVS